MNRGKKGFLSGIEFIRKYIVFSLPAEIITTQVFKGALPGLVNLDIAWLPGLGYSRRSYSATGFATLGSLLYNLYFYKLLYRINLVLGRGYKGFERDKSLVWNMGVIPVIILMVYIVTNIFNNIINFMISVVEFLLLQLVPLFLVVVIMYILIVSLINLILSSKI